MQIIPVLDIMDGRVVRGAGGDRAHYAPIVTPLAPSADPVAVARGLAGLGPFPAFYLADLDAIAGGPANSPVLEALLAAFPDREVWLDAGLANVGDWVRLADQDERIVPVAGSETLAETALLSRPDFAARGVLSLDFKGETFLGAPPILEEAALWPQRVVVMTLARVGSGEGPDLDRLRAITRRAGERRAIYAAGGVRGAEDLRTLAEGGAAGVLVSSALHDGRLGPQTFAG